MGTEGLILQVQSRAEILADKWVALALRPNRIMYRDLWDILWLTRQDIQLDTNLVYQKLDDRNVPGTVFSAALHQRVSALENDPQHCRLFRQEMERFIFASDQREVLGDSGFWNVLVFQLKEQCEDLT